MTATAASFVLNLLFLLGFVGDGWLGIHLAADSEHPVVAEVIPGSPADKAGVQKGDRILAVDDQATDQVDALVELIRGKKAGQRVRLKLSRNGTEMVVLVKLGEKPKDSEAPEPAETPKGERPPAPQGEAQAGRPRIGVEIRETGEGLEVSRVLEGSPAEKAGIHEHDRIVRIGDVEVHAFADIEKAMSQHKAGDKVAVQVRSGDGTRSLMVGLAPATGSLAAPKETTPAPAEERSAFGEDLGAAIGKGRRNGKPVLAVFGAPWNKQTEAQHKAMQDESLRPLLRRFERVYVDTDRQGAVAQEYKVQDLPALLVFKDGKQILRQNGYAPPERLREVLQRALGGEPAAAPGEPVRSEPAPAGPATGGDVQQIRAELAEIKAELAEIRKLLRERR
jgi:membrane-associated protease RseP (regulator of RpoE activity)